MKGIKTLPIITMTVLLLGCTQKTPVDRVIEDLEGMNFDEMRGYSAHYRSRGSARDSWIIFVNQYGLNCSPYSVDVIIEEEPKEFLSIDRDLVLSSCGHDYIDDAKIKSLVSSFVSFGVTVLGVDTFGNVYVNPIEQDLATFVKVMDFSQVNNVNLYRPYKGDWYIRK